MGDKNKDKKKDKSKIFIVIIIILIIVIVGLTGYICYDKGVFNKKETKNEKEEIKKGTKIEDKGSKS